MAPGRRASAVAHPRGGGTRRHGGQSQVLLCDGRADGVLHRGLVIDYQYTTADLKGSLAIADGALDLSGKVVLSEELQDELTGETTRVEKRVIPIAGIGCNVRKPCINLDGRAVASVIGTLAGGGELREKLEETIGKEGVDILDQILRGGR